MFAQCSADELLVSSSARVCGSPVHTDDVVFVTFNGVRCAGPVLLLFSAGAKAFSLVSVWKPVEAGEHDVHEHDAHVAEFSVVSDPQQFSLHEIGDSLRYSLAADATARGLVPLQYR